MEFSTLSARVGATLSLSAALLVPTSALAGAGTLTTVVTPLSVSSTPLRFTLMDFAPIHDET